MASAAFQKLLRSSSLLSNAFISVNRQFILLFFCYIFAHQFSPNARNEFHFIIHSLNSFDREIEKLMASKKGPVFDHSDSYETSWADQWDYNEDRSLKERNSNNKMSDKVKSAASTGFDKAKIVAAVGAKKIKEGSFTGAKKIKEGSSTGIRWIKVQYQKRAKK